MNSGFVVQVKQQGSNKWRNHWHTASDTKTMCAYRYGAGDPNCYYEAEAGGWARIVTCHAEEVTP